MGRKTFIFFSIVLVCAVGILFSQDLMKLSRKEKERRSRLENTIRRIVTNEVLMRLKVLPAVDIPEQFLDQEEIAPDIQEDEQISADQETNGIFALKALPTSEFVQNPEEAIGEPDGKFALIGYWGWLDVELSVSNAEGNDIAVYANRSSDGIQDSRMMHYLVFVPKDSTWVCIGIGGGLTSPEYFDLNDISRVDQVRIMYRNQFELNQMQPNLGQTNRISSYSMRIDSVQALH